MNLISVRKLDETTVWVDLNQLYRRLQIQLLTFNKLKCFQLVTNWPTGKEERPHRLKSHLDTGLGQADPHGQFFAREDIGVVSSSEGLFKLLQLT